ncbi:MAG TPA: glycosyltransferase family 2 protein [Candidatus Pacearchaeota archaeon]|jgi:cellulose synthase/poly-beta-1,6-N-acetylglucosamine synthase-like glycosyltransferase|nr:glycosyltransferase family 2 protein [Candidatus Pacearchaeota archaeon]
MEFITIVIYTSIYIGLVATAFYILTFIADIKREREFFTEDELPKVSVIIPAYNEEKTIQLTIDSILESDYPKDKLDILIVDDGSSDKTYERASEYENKGIRIFKQEVNGGKGKALNKGIKESRGDFIFTMDADTIVDKKSLKTMTRYFKNPEVMSVTPAMVTREAKTIMQRIQSVEYLTGLFLRKTFAALNAIHITPGAFSAYRKSFFEKHGGYDEDNITEDLEVALRIQYHKYTIENAPEAPAYTIPPADFNSLLKQRRRWYVGLIKNTWNYKKLFGKEYGDMGMFVLPIAWIGIFFAVFLTIYYTVEITHNLILEILFYNSINFDVFNQIEFNVYLFERIFFQVFTTPAIWFILIFLIMIFFYLRYATKKIGKTESLYLNVPIFMALFAILFGIWWVVSVFYVVFNREVSWK